LETFECIGNRHLIVLGGVLNLSPYAKVRFNDNKLIVSLKKWKDKKQTWREILKFKIHNVKEGNIRATHLALITCDVIRGKI